MTRVSWSGTSQARAGLGMIALGRVGTGQAPSCYFCGQRSWVGCLLGCGTHRYFSLGGLCVRALEGLAQKFHTFLVN